MRYDILYSDFSKIYTIDIYTEEGYHVESNFFETLDECLEWAQEKYPGITEL